MVLISGGNILLILVCGAIFCLVPLVFLDYGRQNAVNDVIIEKSMFDEYGGKQLLLASFFVAIIPAVDLFLDLPSRVFDHVWPPEKSSSRAIKTEVVRLTEIERLVFILGILLQSTICFVPSSMDVALVSLVYNCTSNCSTIFILAPILKFLNRCTTSFTALRALIIAVTTVMSYGLITLAFFFRDDSYTRRVLNLTGLAFQAFAGILYMCIIYLCAFQYCRQKVCTASDRRCFCNNAFTSCQDFLSLRWLKCRESKVNDGELYTNYIPALHMMSSVLITIGTAGFTLSPTATQARGIVSKNYIVLLAEIMVLVIELRIRKNEIARGLTALLESKKSYVRYISHELRTPLNTAFLGLKLLTSDLKLSSNAQDVDRYDTLCDVNASCTAAVDILNDLLCYEKLDSGILELHKENISVLEFLKDRVGMFSLQARECGVVLKMNMGPTGTAGDATSPTDSIPSPSPSPCPTSSSSPPCPTSSPVTACDDTSYFHLQPHDSIFADKFKMDQVIRNLISNALKFTPSGGTVTIRATFIPSIDQDSVKPSPFLDSSVSSKRRGLSKSRIADRIIYGRSSRSLKTVPSGGDIESTIEEIPPCHGRLVITVNDSGAGISKENQNRLFKEIVQFSPEKLQAGGGSGLGLWITSGIVELHEGKISVHSEGEGNGSSFTVEMPMIRLPPLPPALQPEISSTASTLAEHVLHENFFISNEAFVEPPAPVPAQSSSSSLAPLSVRRPVQPVYDVLVVDDSPLNRKMLLKCLQAAGHNCMSGTDGLIAVEMVKERIDYNNGGKGRPYDAILMDFMMPNMDGPTAASVIRSLGYTAPIFGVTGNGLPSDVSHFISCGVDKVLLKPLDMEAFVRAMRQDDVADDVTRDAVNQRDITLHDVTLSQKGGLEYGRV